MPCSFWLPFIRAGWLVCTSLREVQGRGGRRALTCALASGCGALAGCLGGSRVLGLGCQVLCIRLDLRGSCSCDSLLHHAGGCN